MYENTAKHDASNIIIKFYFIPMMTKPPSSSFSDDDFFESLRSPRKLNMVILCQNKKLQLRKMFALNDFPTFS